MKIAIEMINEHYDNLNPEKSHWMKSCPECSRNARYPVFKLYPEAFGASVARGDHHAGAQSWCLECRTKGK